MTSLLRSVGRSAGPTVTIGLPVAVLGVAATVGHHPTGLVLVVVLPVLAAAAVVALGSTGTPDHEEVLGRLGSCEEEFCLVLRPSGADGPDPRVAAGGRSWTDPDVTLEQVVALAARTATGQRTYTVVDQGDRLTPPGPTYLRVPDPEWRTVAGRLIRRAHSIVLVLPPRPDAAGFSWATEQIVRAGVQHRVIIVPPPLDRDAVGHWAALQQAALLLTALRGSGRLDDVDHLQVHEYELKLDIGTVVLRCTGNGRAHVWTARPAEPPSGRREIVAASYVPALAQAMTDIEQDLRGLDFAVRYPRTGEA